MAIEKPLVLITDYLEEAGIENPVLEHHADVKILNTHTDTDIDPYASKVKGILVFHDIKISARIIAKLDNCMGIVRCGVGYDNVDIQAAGERGIAVCNVPDYGTEEVADHSVMMLLAIARRLIPPKSSRRRSARASAGSTMFAAQLYQCQEISPRRAMICIFSSRILHLLQPVLFDLEEHLCPC